ncbi:tetratricopeptide repeat protein [Shewanella pneumatophori]|uniref:Tetratricopeptide repeat protein n=1 Tax=Shewanella pneumatophori TaxID=314092 RepID=A0A9X1ZJ89_9GAMM|nr:hypothetical protein [Shewanella pneumatophori]MCL1137031.1 hypothetical protein [Shewanella pneumatophori]
MRLIFILPLLILLQGCKATTYTNTPTPTLPQLDYVAATSEQTIPTPEDFYRLTPEQITALEDFLQQEHVVNLANYKQAFLYIKKRLVNFNYQGKNYFASQSLADNGGNCMALAMLTLAIANEMQVELRFQVMHTMPVLLDISDNVAVTSDHVRTLMYETVEDQEGAMFGRNRIKIDYFPDKYDRGGKIINQDEFFAMFYRNLAADAIFAGKLDYAYRLLNKSLTLAPDYEPAINMQAVVLRKLGDLKSAEKLYRYGLEVADNKISLLSNYHFLLRLQGRTEQASLIKEQLLNLDDQSPYAWYLQAVDAMAQQDYQSAKIYLNKFLKNTHYFHKAYYDLAKVYFQLGEPQQAKKAISLALTHSSSREDKDVYLAKLNWLTSLQ